MNRFTLAVLATFAVVPAANAAPQGVVAAAAAIEPAGRTVDAREAKVRSGNVFQIGKDAYLIAGLRAPRVNTAACQFERTRGRDARKALRRLLRSGQLVIVPTGQTTRAGAQLVNARINTVSVRTLLLRTGTVLPREGHERGNPWCLRVAPGTPPAPPPAAQAPAAPAR